MAGLTEALQILITANGGQAVAEFGKVGTTAETQLGRAQSSADKLGSTMTKVGAAAIGLGAVMVGGAYMAAKASEEQTLANTKLENTLRNMPKLAGESAKQFQDQASALQKVTVASDEQIISAQAMLGTFNLTASQMRDMMPLIVDYARKFDTDLVTASKQVGKALDGNVGALKRNGVSIDEAMFKTDRYRAVTEALGRQVKGFAEAEGKTFSGQLAIMKNQLGEIAEGVGVGAVSAFSKLLGPVKGLSSAFQDLSPATQSVVGQIMAFGGAGLILAGAASVIIGQVITMRARFAEAAVAVRGFISTQMAATTTSNLMSQSLTSIGIVLAAGYVSWKLWTDKVKEAGKAMDDTLSPAKAKLATANYDEMQAMLGRVNEQIGGISDTIANSSAPWDEDYRNQLSAAGATLQTFGQGIAATSAMVDGMAAATGKSKNELAVWLNAQQAAGNTFPSVAAALAAYTGVIGTNTLSAEDAAAAQQALSTSFKDAADQLRALTDPIFAVTRAEQQQKDANDAIVKSYMDYVAAINQFGAGSVEAATAADALTAAQQRSGEAGFNTRGALLLLNEAIASGSVTASSFTAELDTLVASGIITQQTADAMAGSFYGATIQAGGFAGQIQGVTAATNEAAIATQNYMNYLAGLNAAMGNEPGAGIGVWAPPPRAGGGTVNAGSPYMVGERGPELFVPRSSGRITPNSALGGGDNVTINVNGSADPRQTAWEIIRARRAQTFLAGAA